MTEFDAAVLPPGIRSRFVGDINGLRFHILEAGFDTPARPLLEEARSARRRRGDMGPIRGEPRGQPRRSPRTGQRRDVSSVAITPEVHTEGRWQATAARHRSN